MDIVGPTDECEVCGGTDFYKEAGHFYCNECQTQSQQIREQVFEQEDIAVNKKSTKKIQKDKNEKTEDKLTSWECYNIILKGLTEELIELGAKSELKMVVKCLWMKYLHKCEVFDIKSDRPPKISVLGSKKDIDILYNVKRRKRRRSRTSSTSTTLSVRRQRSSKKRALIHSQYEELSQSQTLTQDSSLVGETLSSLKSGSESSQGSKIQYNKYSSAALKRKMSKKHQEEHKSDVSGEMSCHKFGTRDFSNIFVRGPAVLTSFTLYSILYIGLLIIEDAIQLGDILRYIREGYLSFGCYRHFFHEDMPDKLLNLPRKNDKLFSNEQFRKRTAKLVHFLDVDKYIGRPDLVQLCSRYCRELNLPKEIFECVEKLIIKTAPKMQFEKNSTEIPNYEGRAMSFILFIFKLFFSLDGVTESKFSEFSRMLNNQKVNTKMFDILEWLKYIGYRDTVIKTYHLPSSLQSCDQVDSDMYLDYMKNQEISFKGSSKHIQSEVKDYLQIFDKLLDSDYADVDDKCRFQHSLTPFLSHIEIILKTEDINCENVLKQTFYDDSIDFLLRPNKYLKLLGNRTVKNGGASDNVVIEDTLYLYKNLYKERKYNETVTVKVSNETDGDRFIEEYLNLDKKASLQATDVDIFLSNWQEANEKKFSRNRALLEIASEHVEIGTKDDGDAGVYSEHYNPFERYWLNIPANPTNIRYFSKSRTQELTAKLSHPFRIILKELTRIIEQETYDFYVEFLVTEINLVYFDGYCSKGKKSKVPEIQRVLKDCWKNW